MVISIPILPHLHKKPMSLHYTPAFISRLVCGKPQMLLQPLWIIQWPKMVCSSHLNGVNGAQERVTLLSQSF